MSSSLWRRRAYRRSAMELVEPRLVMSGDSSTLLANAALVATEPTPDLQLLGTASTSDMTGVDHVRNDYGLTGYGQTVAVIDTGIAYTHTALGGGYGAGYRVVGGYDFTGEAGTDPYDDGPLGSHGTHVAGIIASDDLVRPGVAPEVDLVALRVFDDSGGSSFDRVEAALRWVHTNRNAFTHPITTVNLSLGVDENNISASGYNQIEDELAQLYADGIFVSAAAGNKFTSYNTAGVTYPASSSYVVPVASVDNSGDLSYFSQRSSRVIAAPGQSVLSTVPDYAGNRNGIDDDFARYSGTSMSTAYVSGAAVLLRQAYQQVGVTQVTVDQLYNDMLASADIVHDTITGQDYHRLNLGRAVDNVFQQHGTSTIAGTLGVFDPDHGMFVIESAAAGVAGTSITVGSRRPGCVPILGDWNGDGVDTIGLYDPNTSTFYLKNSNRSGNADITYSFGTPRAGWVPVVGDWNGDGIDTVGLYNPTSGTFYLKNTHTNRSAEIVFTVRGTRPAWLPVAGDWDGDGRTNVGVFDPATATAYLTTRTITGTPETTVNLGNRFIGWLPVAGDWDRDGTETLGFYNKASGAFVLRNGYAAGASESTVLFGAVGSSWLPVVGNWGTSAGLRAAAATSTGGVKTAQAPADDLTDVPSPVGGVPAGPTDSVAAGPLPSPAPSGPDPFSDTLPSAALPPVVGATHVDVGAAWDDIGRTSAAASWQAADRMSYLNMILAQLRSPAGGDETLLAHQAARRQLAALLAYDAFEGAAEADSIFAEESAQDFYDLWKLLDA